MNEPRTAYIRHHADLAGALYDDAGAIIGTYTVANRFRQKPGAYAVIHARINGERYEGTKFERSRRGQVRLSHAPWNNDEPDGPRIGLIPASLDSMRRAGIIAILALALLPITTHAAPPTFDTPLFPTSAYLAGCELRGAWDDGSRVLTCDEDGAILVFDPDGQRWVNAAGAPVRAPGYYELEEGR